VAGVGPFRPEGGSMVSVPCRAVPCRAVPCRAVPCRAVRDGGCGRGGRAHEGRFAVTRAGNLASEPGWGDRSAAPDVAPGPGAPVRYRAMSVRPAHPHGVPPGVRPGSPGGAERSIELDGLVAEAVRGDRAAVGGVLAVVRPVIVRYCRARMGDRERLFVSPDDVAQEVCVAVLRALPGYHAQGRPFLAFVYGIAAHKVVDAHRAAARHRAGGELTELTELAERPDPHDGPEQRAIDTMMSGQMRRLLDTLAPRQREVLVLRFVVGLSVAETADSLGSTPGAVRVAAHRALAALRATLHAPPSTESEGHG